MNIQSQTPTALAALRAVLEFAHHVAFVDSCEELQFDDTPDMRAFIQAVIGDEFELTVQRGKLVVSTQDVADYFLERVKEAQTASQSANVTTP